jgi:uncharacterized protein (DUF58 family)
LKLIRQLVSATPVRHETNLGSALDYLNRVQKRRAVVFLLSDFLAPTARRALAVANRRHDLVAVTVDDPRELALPDVGFITLEDAEMGEIVELDARHPRVRELFCSQAIAREQQLAEALKKSGIDQLAIQTDADYQKSFRRFFHMRERRFR